MTVSAKVKLVNTYTAEAVEALYNPEQIEDTLRATYGKHRRVDGHSAVKYESTDRQEFPVSFFLDNRYEQTIQAPGQGRITMGDFQRFINSLLYPIELPSGDKIDPPQVLLVWSNLYCQTCVLVDRTFRFTRFESDLRPAVYTAECRFMEAGFKAFTSDERRNEYTLGSYPS